MASNISRVSEPSAISGLLRHLRDPLLYSCDIELVNSDQLWRPGQLRLHRRRLLLEERLGPSIEVEEPFEVHYLRSFGRDFRLRFVMERGKKYVDYLDVAVFSEKSGLELLEAVAEAGHAVVALDAWGDRRDGSVGSDTNDDEDGADQDVADGNSNAKSVLLHKYTLLVDKVDEVIDPALLGVHGHLVTCPFDDYPFEPKHTRHTSAAMVGKKEESAAKSAKSHRVVDALEEEQERRRQKMQI